MHCACQVRLALAISGLVMFVQFSAILLHFAFYRLHYRRMIDGYLCIVSFVMILDWFRHFYRFMQATVNR